MSQAFPLMILVALPPKMAMTVDRGGAREKKVAPASSATPVFIS